MSNFVQDSNILSSLAAETEATAYTISKDIQVSVPQVQYRIDKLVKCGIIKAKKISNKTLYSVHPALKSKEAMEEIASYIKAIVDTIDEVERLSPEGMKALISFIISKTDMTETEEEVEVAEDEFYSEQEENCIKLFREFLESYAKEKNLKILDIKGWTNNKIEWMALNGRKCGCKPDERVCPCEEGLKEVETKGRCLCSVFGYKGVEDYGVE